MHLVAQFDAEKGEMVMRASTPEEDAQSALDQAAAHAETSAANLADVDAYLAEVRDMRERLLNRLAGIAAAAIVGGDTATQNAFVQARQSLLDITSIPAAIAAYKAADLAALQTAIKLEYVAIVGRAPHSLKTAFDEVDK